MAVSTITSKGQITIPKRVRERLRLRAGDKLDFRVEDDGTVTVRPISRKVSEVFGALRERTSRKYATSEIDKRLRGAFKKGKA